MITDNKVVVTAEGLETIKKELENLYLERKKITHQIKEARSYGDLSENSEYQEVKDRQDLLETRIVELENIIRHAVIDEGKCERDRVCVGSVVEVKLNGKTSKYTIVGATQADPSSGKISADSPVGKALMGKSGGDEAIVKTPRGDSKISIVKLL